MGLKLTWGNNEKNILRTKKISDSLVISKKTPQ